MNNQLPNNSFESILMDRVEYLILRAKKIGKKNKSLSDFLLKEAKDICIFHDQGNLFLTCRDLSQFLF